MGSRQDWCSLPKHQCKVERPQLLGAPRLADARDGLPVGMPGSSALPVEWRETHGLLPYDLAVAVMDARAAGIAAGSARELVWLIEHPSIYTAGTSAKSRDLLDPQFPVFASGRGGEFTYHGPGQRVAYVMLNLKRRIPDVRRFVATLELWLIRTLRNFGVCGERREDRVGIWVRRYGQVSSREEKIAAIGVRVRHFVTMHGISLNVAPDLTHFAGIVPCGMPSSLYGVTSLAALGTCVRMAEVDAVLRCEFEPLFGPSNTVAGDPPELAELRTMV
jgi:lipoyl(octanoyl) transferase